MDVYFRLGCGFLEPVYQDALSIEFELRKIPFVSQARLPIKHKHLTLKKTYRADFVCNDKITVEVKALSALTPIGWLSFSNI